MIYRNISGNRTFHKLVCFADSIGNLTFDDFLSVETIHRNFGICCHDNTVCFLDLFVSKYIFCSAGASCFYFNEAIFRLGCFFQSFCCHVGVGNTCRAGSNCQQPGSGSFGTSSVCQSLINILLLIVCLVDDLHKFIYRFRIAQGLCKIVIHQHYGKFAEYIQMNIVFCIRCCDQKKQCNRLIVQSFELHAVFYNHGCKSRFLYCVTFSMRNGDSLTDSCCALFLS